MTVRTRAIMLVLLTLAAAAACGPGGRGGEADEVEIDESLGTLKVMNEVDEPVAVYLDGQEIYTVPPGSSNTFRNLPTGEVTIYGVGRISQKHYSLPELTIEEGGDYEWTIKP